MARYGRDYDRGYHGQGGDGGRFWGPERHLFEGLFSRGDRESGNPGRDYDRDFRAGAGNMGGYGSRNRGYDRDMHMGGSSFSRDYDRDHGIGRGGFQGSFGINNQMNDRALGIGRYDTEYGATSRGRNLPYRRDVHVDHDAISRDHLPYRRDVHADHDEISRNTFHGGGRDVYRTGGMGGMNRGGGDWDGDGDRDMGDRLREGWNGLQQGARRIFRGNRDRNW